MANINDYVLVRDKDGQLKYYKDGKFFELSEIEAPAAQTLAQKDKKSLDLTAELQDVPTSTPKEGARQKFNQQIQQTVDDIINELKVSFSDPAIKKRFTNLIASKLRDIRSDKELVYMFSVPKKDGGLGLDERKANLILAVIKKHEEPFVKESKGLAHYEEGKEIKQEISQKTKPLQQEVIDKEPKKQEVKVDVKKTEPKPNPQEIIKQEVKSQTEPKKTSQPLVPIEPEDVPYDFSAVQTVRKQVSQKPQKTVVNDVNYKTKLSGPIEELQDLTLDNFHRMGINPEEIVEEIKEKVDLLKQEDYKKGLQGIQAWQKSDVYKIYNEMGIQSIMTGKDISQIIAQRQIENKPTLTESEFKAIIDLNKQFDI